MPKTLKTFVAEDYGITFLDTVIVSETTRRRSPIS